MTGFQELAHQLRSERGYGRGWSEPRAIGRWRRARQWWREPATKADWVWALVAMAVFCSAAMIAAGLAA